MTARYVLRLDDACNTMHREKWRTMEGLLDEFGIRPLVAVIPNNLDPALHYAAIDPEFWGQVRAWQAKGWSIAMHGYQHLLHPTRSKLVLPYYQHSEFGGLNYDQQAEKIRQSWKIFTSQGVEPSVWIAPAHCFDWLTLKAIKAETPIRIVSDGIARDQYYEADFHWVPQQLWSLTEKSDGLWTVCLHPNTMIDQQVIALRQRIEAQFSGRIIALNDVVLTKRKKSLRDSWEDLCFWQHHRMNKAIHRAKAIIRD